MEILNTYVTQDVEWWWALLIFFFINCACVGIALLYDSEWYIGLIVGTLVFCFVILLMFASGAFKQYTVCEAHIDDTMSFNDIYGHYEIISQRGNIYTLKELNK